MNFINKNIPMKLYTTNNCTVCDASKALIKEKNLDIEIIHIDMETEEWEEIASDARIRWVPTLDADKRYIGGDVITFLTSL